MDTGRSAFAISRRARRAPTLHSPTPHSPTPGRRLRRLARTAALVALAVFAASCGGNGDSVVLGDEDNGSEVSIESGERFEVRLESNPSTGFSWQLDVTAIEGVIELTASSLEEPADAAIVGAAGTEVFEFEAIAHGAGVLRLEYLRPTDDPPIPERIVEFIIRVDQAPWPPDEPSTPPATSTVSAPDTASAINVSSLFDGEGPREATISGIVIWDDASARLCETIMESFPPQCGGLWVVIADPHHLDVELDEHQGVRWTANQIEIAATFDGNRLIIDPSSTTPTDSDEAMIAAFSAFAADPDVGVAGLALASQVAIGLGPELIASLDASELSDPASWRIDRSDFRGWSGPFSALDIVAEPYAITIGAHPHCASPPERSPEGFAEHRRVSIQPTAATSCLEWWSVDFFLNDSGAVEAVTLDLFAP